jgi:hypothetical protein
MTAHGFLIDENDQTMSLLILCSSGGRYVFLPIQYKDSNMLCLQIMVSQLLLRLKWKILIHNHFLFALFNCLSRDTLCLLFSQEQTLLLQYQAHHNLTTIKRLPPCNQ